MSKEEIERWLYNFDNLIDCNQIPKNDVSDYVFYHKQITLDNFLSIGREIIRQSLENNN